MRSKRHDPPGPRGLEILSVLRDWQSNGLLALERLAARYGDVTFANLFGKRVYLLTHPDLIQHVLIEKRDNYLKTPGNAHAQRYFGDSMQLNNGDKAKQMRRLLAPAFQQSRVTREYCDIVVEETRAAAATWQAGPRPTLTADLLELALTVAVRIHFGTAPGADTTEFAALFRSALTQLNGFLPPEWLPIPKLKRYQQAIEQLDREILRRIQARRVSGPTGPDLLSRFVVPAADHSRAMTDEEIRNELASMMAAGYQTVGIAINQTLRQVAMTPPVDAAIDQEVRRELNGRDAGANDLAHLPYSDQVVKESLRCAPPAGAIARKVATEDNLQGWRIYANSQILISSWVMHRDARFYDEPLRFKPERWTPEFESALAPCAYFPFGRGARACIAGAMSMTILRLMLVTIAQKWRVEPEKPEEAAARPFDRGDVPMILSARPGAERPLAHGVARSA